MATFCISIAFTTTVKDHDKAYALADRISNYVVAEKMAKEGAIIDVELLDDDDGDTMEDLNFGDDE